MIRKLNYTQRKKILVKHARFSTVREKANQHHVNMSLALQDYIDDLPGDAVVFIEAYTRTKVERFKVANLNECGEILSQSYMLSEFSDIEVENLHFRVKIVDESDNVGRILAIADRLPRTSSLEQNENTKSILGVDYQDMGDRLWKLDLERNIPYLVINNQLVNPKDLVKNNDLFFATVYPEVIRQILADIFLAEDSDEDYSDCDDPDDWRYLWSCFARNITGIIKVPKDIQERKEWIDDCIRAFCSKHRLLKRAEQALGNF